MCKCAASCALYAVNAAIVIIGLVVTTAGALLTFGQDFIINVVLKAIAIAGTVAGTVGGTGTAVSLKNMQVLIGQYVVYLNAAGWVIFIFGLILVGIGILGCCGASHENKTCLTVWCIIIAAVLVIMVILTCLVAFNKSGLKAEGEKHLKKYVKDTFVGLNAGTNAESAIFSLMMVQIGCCGVVNGSDFSAAGAPKWNRTYVFSGNKTVITLKYPLACCKMNTGSFTPKDLQCVTNPTTTNSNMNNGCYTMLWNFMDGYSNYTVYGLIALCAILLILIILGIITMKCAI